MSDNNPLMNIGDLAKPINTLVDKIAGAVGIWYEPTRIEKKAVAEGKALLIRKQAELDAADLERRTYQRVLIEECIRQENMEAITGKALPLLNDQSTPDEVEDDWLVHFFDKCRLISDEKMQDFWSKTLAGEANAPGTFSKRAITLLSELDMKDAILFKALCGFMITFGDHFLPFIQWMPRKDSIFHQHGIDRDALIHLQTLGLITVLEGPTQIHWRDLEEPTKVTYFEEQLVFHSEVRNGKPVKMFYAGVAFFTGAGAQLARITGAQPVEGYIDYFIETIKPHIAARVSG